MLTKCFTLTITIIVSLASSGLALQCYHCDSLRDSTCGDRFESNELYKVDCDRLQQQSPRPIQQFGPFYIANATGCVKRIFDYLPGKPRFLRTCFYGDGKRTSAGCLSDPAFASQRTLSCDVCTNDYCNGSTMLSSTGLGIVLFIALSRAFI